MTVTMTRTVKRRIKTVGKMSWTSFQVIFLSMSSLRGALLRALVTEYEESREFREPWEEKIFLRILTRSQRRQTSIRKPATVPYLIICSAIKPLGPAQGGLVHVFV